MALDCARHYHGVQGFLYKFGGHERNCFVSAVDDGLIHVFIKGSFTKVVEPKGYGVISAV
jgi:hypothetical protein